MMIAGTPWGTERGGFERRYLTVLQRSERVVREWWSSSHVGHETNVWAILGPPGRQCDLQYGETCLLGDGGRLWLWAGASTVLSSST
jgi:hypothetical protein